MTDLSTIENKENFMNRPSDVRNYEVFKKEFDEEIHRAADSYVRIGYLLMEARDTGILQGSGYATMSDFAKAEYGLSPDQTSRFISVCEKFGDGEGHLKTEYEAFGQTKLIEMLSLPESVTESISPELTREEIRDIKNEVKEEQKITPLEVAMEPVSMPENFDDIEKFVWSYLEEHPDKYVELADQIGKAAPGAGNEKEIILNALAPTGIAVLQARIPRMGRLLLSFTGDDKNPALVFVRDDRREEVDWHTLYETLENRVSNEETLEDDPKERWSKTYGKEYPGIAPAQIVEPQKKEKEPQSKSPTNFAGGKEKEEPLKDSHTLEKNSLEVHQTQSPTNFDENKPENEEIAKTENEETGKVAPGAESGEQEEDKVSPALEEKDIEIPESKSQTNIEQSCKLSASEESVSDTEPEPVQGNNVETPGQVTDPYIIKERVKRAAKDLDETLNLHIIDIPMLHTSGDIQESLDRVEEKIATWRNLMIEWRKSKE